MILHRDIVVAANDCTNWMNWMNAWTRHCNRIFEILIKYYFKTVKTVHFNMWHPNTFLVILIYRIEKKNWIKTQNTPPPLLKQVVWYIFYNSIYNWDIHEYKVCLKSIRFLVVQIYITFYCWKHFWRASLNWCSTPLLHSKFGILSKKVCLRCEGWDSALSWCTSITLSPKTEFYDFFLLW